MSIFDKFAQHETLLVAARREKIPPLLLPVEYRGNLTVSHQLRDYEGRKWAPISDSMFDIDVTGIFPVPIVFEGSGRGGYLRALNVAEILELGRETAKGDKIFYSGQEIRTRFGRQVLYVTRHAAGLMPIGRNGIRPMTWAPDPLKKLIPAPS